MDTANKIEELGKHVHQLENKLHRAKEILGGHIGHLGEAEEAFFWELGDYFSGYRDLEGNPLKSSVKG